MQKLRDWKARSPKWFSALSLAFGIATVAGIAAYEKRASADSCCYPGSPCCHPGAPCCAGHKQLAAK